MSDKEIYQNPGRGNRAIFGFIIVLIGVGILLKHLGLFPHIHIRQTWPLILIVIGLFVGIQKGFRNNAWWILILIGVINMIPEFNFRVGDKMVDSEDLIWPAFLILGGLVIILKPSNKCKKVGMGKHMFNTMSANVINTDVVFGGRKEVVTSKEFKGGSVTATFGGAEINMLQADTPGNIIELYARATFGGVEIIVPSHWEIKNEIETVMGSVEDHRILKMADQTNKKTLILKGTCFCGGIEIKSF